jgi:YrbI family 3-deoxy-D-manno-octulosonate 8-phosphate phosphatase
MIVGIIPARGGSKGIPRKNIKYICGYPLIYWSIMAAKQSKLLDDFYVSTEDSEIAEIAEKYGAKVLLRPLNLAQDYTTTLEVICDIVGKIGCSDVVVLQPTSPIRDITTIDECISDYKSESYDTLATGSWVKMIEFGTHRNLRRQDIKGFFYDDGNVYIISKEVILRNQWYGDKICRKVLTRELNFEIDDDIDFFIVENILHKRIIERKQFSEISIMFKQVKLLIMDVDGVLTDASMFYSEKGDELKMFNTRDGHGIKLLRDAGIKTAILTSEDTQIVQKRSEKLKIDYVCQGAKRKIEEIMKIKDYFGLKFEEIAYIGDDLIDVEVLKCVGAPVAVADAPDYVKKHAIYVTKTPGGKGAVREVCDIILGLNIY